MATRPRRLTSETNGEMIELPIIDSLMEDVDRPEWAIIFIPEDSVSRREKELAQIPLNSHEGKRIRICLDRLSRLTGKKIERVTHGGGANFTLHLKGGGRRELKESRRSDRM